jgi:hypothetical protein
MFETWSSTIVVALTACTAVIAMAEFYGGAELQLKIKKVLEDWWLRIAELRLPNVGQAEAHFALRIMQRLFGSWAFGIRRFTASAALVLIVGGALVLAEPGITENLLQSFTLHFPYAVTITWMSISLTYFVLDYSISRFSRSRFSSLKFLLALFASVLLSFLIYPIILTTNATVLIVLSALNTPELLPYWEDPLLGAVGANSGPLFTLYLLHGVLMLLRIVIAFGFVAWLMAGVVLRALHLTIYRLFEAEKGALTVIAGFLTALAVFVEWANST